MTYFFVKVCVLRIISIFRMCVRFLSIFSFQPQKYVVKKPDELKIINEQKQLTAQNDFLKKFSTLTLDCIKKEYEDELRDIQKDAKYDDFKGHMKQNRTHKVRCMDVGRVVLTVNVPPQIDYIHANTVKLPKCPKEFICTQVSSFLVFEQARAQAAAYNYSSCFTFSTVLFFQAPRENTQGDFWRMVSQFETKKIFYFNCPNDIDYIDDFFPKESGAYANYGDVFVSNKRAWKDTTLQLEMHNLEVLPDGCSNSIIVQLVIIEDWPDGGLPEEERLVLRAALLASDGMNVVLDRCGADRPGIFISACLAMERFKIDFVIDVSYLKL